MSPTPDPIARAGPPALDDSVARPETVSHLLQEAQRLFGLGQFEQALPLYEQLAHAWGDREAWQCLPFLYRFTRQMTKALDVQRWVLCELGESAQGAAHLS
ncbi:MAG: hypothetical protein IIA65_10210, partial [Planctomycetes bacterium]|nr:hypothetical protein [Planctomycetota bacterium]